MNKKLPIRKFTISEKDGSWVKAIAITETPAIQSMALKFSDEKPILKFAEIKEHKELLAIAMKADELIYRESADGGYWGYFDKPTIRLISQLFAKKGLANCINLEHSEVSADAVAYQSFIIDEKMGINSPKGLNAKEGDWVVVIKCFNDELYDVFKTTEVGLSVEGIFQIVDEEFKTEFKKLLDDEQEILNAYYAALLKI